MIRASSENTGVGIILDHLEAGVLGAVVAAAIGTTALGMRLGSVEDLKSLLNKIQSFSSSSRYARGQQTTARMGSKASSQAGQNSCSLCILKL